jgi:hypothetical protein
MEVKPCRKFQDAKELSPSANCSEILFEGFHPPQFGPDSFENSILLR